MKLLIQPSDGIASLVRAINKAKSKVEIAIFRFDQAEIGRALAQAAKRGVSVHALIAYTNRGGERNLRKLEMRLLDAGVIVARTADDLARYHAKYVIIDRNELFVLAFNFTHIDIEKSRSFGIITRNPKLVQEAVKLFESDSVRQPYKPSLDDFLVSPTNARKQLCLFVKKAKKELLIYDPEVSDPALRGLLEERLAAGVDVKIIGRLNPRKSQIPVCRLSQIRLHARVIIRDGRDAFIGSQSLREAELDNRREVGIVLRDRKIVNALSSTFRDDWKLAKESADSRPSLDAPNKVAKRVAKAVSRDLPPVAPVVEGVVQAIIGTTEELPLDSDKIEEKVKRAVSEAVRNVVTDAVKEASK